MWHFCGVTHGNKVEKIQERCLRIIYKDYESSYDRLLDRANTTKLAISRLRILILVFKSIHILNPKCISDLYELKSTNYSFRKNVEVLQPKRRTTTYGLRTISSTGAQLWNDLSPILCNVGNLDILKSSLTLLTEDCLDPTFTYIYMRLCKWSYLNMWWDHLFTVINHRFFHFLIQIVYIDYRTVYI